jgi:hypothetical protein
VSKMTRMETGTATQFEARIAEFRAEVTALYKVLDAGRRECRIGPELADRLGKGITHLFLELSFAMQSVALIVAELQRTIGFDTSEALEHADRLVAMFHQASTREDTSGFEVTRQLQANESPTPAEAGTTSAARERSH